MNPIHIRHPHRRALLPISGLTGLFLLTALAAWSIPISEGIKAPVLWVSFCASALFGLSTLLIWVLGLIQIRRTRAFLDSERVLARWTYSTGEWAQLKEALWQEEKGDWKIQLGCLTFLFSLVGLLTGILIGLDEGVSEAVIYGFAGLAFGGLIGAGLGAIVAGSNYASARYAYADPEPGVVALGTQEIYFGDAYFRGNGGNRHIQEATLEHSPMPMLMLRLVFPPRPRMPSEEQWNIYVPEKWLDRVEEIIPQLTAQP